MTILPALFLTPHEHGIIFHLLVSPLFILSMFYNLHCKALASPWLDLAPGNIFVTK